MQSQSLILTRSDASIFSMSAFTARFHSLQRLQSLAITGSMATLAKIGHRRISQRGPRQGPSPTRACQSIRRALPDNDSITGTWSTLRLLWHQPHPAQPDGNALLERSILDHSKSGGIAFAAGIYREKTQENDGTVLVRN